MSVLAEFYDYVRNSQELKQHKFVFLLNQKYFEETDNIRIETNVKKDWLHRLMFDLFTGKKYIKKINPDLVISLQNTIVFGLKCKQFVYVHQAIPFQIKKNFSFFKRSECKYAIIQKMIGYIIKRSIKKADLTIVQTKWMKESIKKCTHISEKRIIDIMPNINILRVDNSIKFDNHSFFYPANNDLYKNHKCIYDACKILNEERDIKYNIDLTIENGEIIDNINYIGKLPIKKVYEKYKESTLIFPSYIETVGLPLIEAKENGSIILVADCDYAKEVLNGYENVYYFNPFDSKELSELMKRIINNDIVKKEIKLIQEEKNNGWSLLFSKIN